MTDKVEPTARQLRVRKTIRSYVLMTILAFVAFLCFDMADGDANGIRGLITFIELITGDLA